MALQFFLLVLFLQKALGSDWVENEKTLVFDATDGQVVGIRNYDWSDWSVKNMDYAKYGDRCIAAKVGVQPGWKVKKVEFDGVPTDVRSANDSVQTSIQKALRSNNAPYTIFFDTSEEKVRFSNQESGITYDWSTWTVKSVKDSHGEGSSEARLSPKVQPGWKIKEVHFYNNMLVENSKWTDVEKIEDEEVRQSIKANLENHAGNISYSITFQKPNSNSKPDNSNVKQSANSNSGRMNFALGFPTYPLQKGQTVYVMNNHVAHEAKIIGGDGQYFSVKYNNGEEEHNVNYSDWRRGQRIWRVRPTCRLCGELNHTRHHCPKAQCTHCFGHGHIYERDCPLVQAKNINDQKFVYVMKNWHCYEAEITDSYEGKFSVKYTDYSEEHNIKSTRILKESTQCFHCGEMDHMSFGCPSIQCSYCSQFGHNRKRDCKVKYQENQFLQNEIIQPAKNEKYNFWAEPTVYLMFDNKCYEGKIIKVGGGRVSVKYTDYGVEHNVRKSRIFQTRPRCHKCSELNHLASQCPKLKCAGCFESGHSLFNCLNKYRRCIVCKVKGHNRSKCPQENEFDEKDTRLWQKRRKSYSESWVTNRTSQEHDLNERKNNPNFVSKLKRKLEDVCMEEKKLAEENNKGSYIVNEIPSRNSNEEIDPKQNFEEIYQLNQSDNLNRVYKFEEIYQDKSAKNLQNEETKNQDKN